VVQLSEDRFRIDFDNPNRVRVGVQFRLRIYRWDGQEPEVELVHVYVPPNNTVSHNVPTGGCGERPEVPEGTGAPAEPPRCNIRVTATLMDQYYVASE